MSVDSSSDGQPKLSVFFTANAGSFLQKNPYVSSIDGPLVSLSDSNGCQSTVVSVTAGVLATTQTCLSKPSTMKLFSLTKAEGGEWTVEPLPFELAGEAYCPRIAALRSALQIPSLESFNVPGHTNKFLDSCGYSFDGISHDLCNVFEEII